MLINELMIPITVEDLEEILFSLGLDESNRENIDAIIESGIIGKTEEHLRPLALICLKDSIITFQEQYGGLKE